ncbi:MAG TPA: A/G-specific adenine glycosylase [Candidatus Omnitrophica bacterium]|nr:A/G-specific adenine glycosylase [Candidatus Omnitrophota bacterium]
MLFQTNKFRSSLQAWYRRFKRDLPWRKTNDPYRILVSEIMLQQTQVSTVIPYYIRWLRKFPDFETLAAADEATVLKQWQGLGYYRRAKMLRLNAQAVCRDHGGKLPSDFNALLDLPGIGRYTAGAIASIAFEKRKPVLDGNVIRILTRLFAIKKNTALRTTVEDLWKKAETLLPKKNIGDFNQALMELGATVCFPQKPNCSKCPVSFTCRAHHLKQEEAFPVKSPAVKATKQTFYALALTDSRGRVLIQKQKAGERWAGLWTLPHFVNLEDGLANWKIKGRALQPLRSHKHGFTRYQITLHSFKTSAPSHSVKLSDHLRWAAEKEIRNYAFPAVYQKIMDEVF